MEDYTNLAVDGVFTELKDDKGFRRDLVRFFSGDRYNYSIDEIKEKGAENLTAEFVEHMRKQSWNEVTAIMDYNYVINKDSKRKGVDAFGRLTQAWDSSDRAGSSSWGEAVGDFAEGVFTAPSTYAGFGIGKLFGKAASKGVQIGVRKALKDRLLSTAKGAAAGFGTEAAIGGVQSGFQGETREEIIEGFEYTGKDLAKDAIISGAGGAVFGGIAGLSGSFSQSKKASILEKRKVVTDKLEDTAKTNSTTTFKNTSKKRLADAARRVTNLESVLAAKAGDKTATILNPLDPELVNRGGELLKVIGNPQADGTLRSGLSINTVRSVTAATIDLLDTFQVKEGERITSAVARAISDPNASPQIISKLDDIRAKYNLTKEQMSLIYLAEVSESGKILAEQSIIARAKGRSASDAIKTIVFDETEASLSLKILSDSNVSTISDQQAINASMAAIRNSSEKGILGTGLEILRDTDAMRVAFMTSQIATTARNVTSTGILTGVDLMDEFYRELGGAGKDILSGKRPKGDAFRRMTAVLRGLTWNDAQKSILREMFKEEMPEAYLTVFNDAMRVELGTGSNSWLAKTGRAVNIANTATDTFFKEAGFFASIDRQLSTRGITMKDFLEKGMSLSDLEDGVVTKAYDDANRFTMQRNYANDQSAFGKAARTAQVINRKVPFVVSAVFGIPFPRYVANHLEMISDYTPVWGELLRAMDKKGLTSDPVKTGADRIVRQFTGASMLFAGYQLAASKQGEIDYSSLETSLKAEADVASSAGYVIAHMFVGDLVYRYVNGLPIKFDARTMSDILGGVSDLSADFTMIEELYKSVKEGKMTDGLQKSIGNVAATFTYPGTVLRDMQGQVNYESAGTPYVKDVFGIGPNELKGDVSLKGENAFNTQLLVGQATRFLPDTKLQQYTQSFNGETDIDYYTPFNPAPVGKINPLMKQITGIVQAPPLTELQRELNVLALEEFDLYRSSTEKNASIDFVLRQRLSQTMPKEFELWRSEVQLGGLAKGKTYDELDDDYKLKKQFLTDWVSNKISSEKKVIEGYLSDYIANNRVAARGYIRNNYDIKIKELGKDLFNEAAREASNGTFENSKDFLADSESVKEELTRRLIMLQVVGDIRKTPGL